jgi:hypothetical protein
VLDAWNNHLGMFGDRLHVSQAVIEVVRDSIEQYPNNEQKDRQNSDQSPDANYRQDNENHV